MEAPPLERRLVAILAADVDALRSRYRESAVGLVALFPETRRARESHGEPCRQ